MEYELDRDLRFEPGAEPGLLATEINDRWSIATPNGGYLMALAARAAGTVLPEHTDPVVLSAVFHRPARPGPAEIRLEEPLARARLATVRAELRQEGTTLLETTLTAARPGSLAGERWLAGRCPVPPIERCAPLPERPFTFSRRVDIRMPEEQHDWMRGGSGAEPLFTGWASFVDRRPLDRLALLLLADAMPPPVMRKLGMIGWVPTVQMTTQVLVDPEGEKVAFVARCRHISGVLTETDVELWDEAGDLVALARQLALIKRG